MDDENYPSPDPSMRPLSVNPNRVVIVSFIGRNYSPVVQARNPSEGA
jgi:hypothetical protein